MAEVVSIAPVIEASILALLVVQAGSRADPAGAIEESLMGPVVDESSDDANSSNLWSSAASSASLLAADSSMLYIRSATASSIARSRCFPLPVEDDVGIGTASFESSSRGIAASLSRSNGTTGPAAARTLFSLHWLVFNVRG